MRLTWLHISDLHFGVSKEELDEQSLVLERIKTDVHRICSEERISSPSCIYATGDLISKADGSTNKLAVANARAQFSNVNKWLRSLAKELDILPTRIYCVPGNHDVVWRSQSNILKSFTSGVASITNPIEYKKHAKDIARTYQEILLPATENPQSSPNTGDLMSSLQCYRSFCNRFAFARNLDPTMGQFYLDGSFWNRQITGANSHITVLGLNTAWACSQQTNNLPMLPSGIPEQLMRLISDIQSTELADSTNILTIAMMHHPVGWLLPDERPQTTKLLHEYVDVLLRGHEHIDWINQYGFGLLEIASPAAFQRDKKLKRGYSLVEFDQVTRRCRVYVQEYAYDFNAFEPSKTIRKQSNFHNNKSQLVQLAASEIRNESTSNSTAFVRRFGFTSEYLQPSQNCPNTGAVLLLDIFRFSSMSIDQQVEAVRSLWLEVSRQLCKIDKAIYAACTPCSDGATIAIMTENEIDAATCALVVGRNVIEQLESFNILPRSISVRGGVAIGKIAVLHQKLLESTTITGTCVNAARKAAFVADPGTIVCSHELLEKCKTANYGTRLLDAPSDTRPYLSLSMTMAPKRQGVIEPKIRRSVHAFRDAKTNAERDIESWVGNVIASSIGQSSANTGHIPAKPKAIGLLFLMRQTIDGGHIIDVIEGLTTTGCQLPILLSNDKLLSIAIKRHRTAFIDDKAIAKMLVNGKIKGGYKASTPTQLEIDKQKRWITFASPIVEGTVLENSMAIPILMVATSKKTCGEKFARTLFEKCSSIDFPLDAWRSLHAVYA